MGMVDVSEHEGYSFKKIKSNKNYRPFKVICCENAIEEDSAVSYEDAINLILSQINYSKEVNRINNESKEYIEKNFKILLDKSISEIDYIYDTQIRYKIDNIRAIKRDEFALEQVYVTPNFKIIVSRNNYRSRISNIKVEEIITD